jgi:hypothetical protein
MMIPDDNNNLNNQDDYSKSDDTAHIAGEADSAEFNERQFEQTVSAGQTDRETVPDANMDTARFNSSEQNQAVNEREDDVYENAENPDAGATAGPVNQQPLTTQGDAAQIEENMGGTTNLTLDQLKKEHDPEGPNNG